MAASVELRADGLLLQVNDIAVGDLPAIDGDKIAAFVQRLIERREEDGAPDVAAFGSSI
jgi:hypothetical protein